MEELAFRNGSLYRETIYSQHDYINGLITVDSEFKLSLEKIGLSEERWNKIAYLFLYIGAIRKLSRNQFDYTQKNDVQYRCWLLSDKCHASEPKATLKKALSYFHINEDEWIKYGDAVIGMYNLDGGKDIQEFGLINAIKPMPNNLHLL